MNQTSLSPPSYWHPTNQPNLNPFTTSPTAFNPIKSLRFNNQNLPVLRSALNPSSQPPPVVVVGSANADIYVEIDRLPKDGETISAKTGITLPGGKGANQACCAAKLSHPTYFVGQIGDDAHGSLVADALREGGVRLDYLAVVPAAPTGHAVVMLQASGQNSIVFVGGANVTFWPERLPVRHLEFVSSAGIVLLQGEIPDFVNVQVAKAARNAGVPVIFDAGGLDAPIPQELLDFVDILVLMKVNLVALQDCPLKVLKRSHKPL